jgi:hypothetical protein
MARNENMKPMNMNTSKNENTRPTNANVTKKP